jgi:hypothetical protein
MFTKNRTARRLAAVSAGTALALSLFVVACGDDDGGGDASTPDQLKLVIKGRDQIVTLVDNPAKRVAPPGSKLDKSKETPGDLAVQQATLRDSSGEKVGQTYSVFTTVGDSGTEMVTGTFTLKNGTLIGQGMIGTGPKDAEEVLAITGGTDDFAGARGILRVSQDADTVRLLAEFTD